MRYKIEKFTRRLKFAFGLYDRVMLLPYVFAQEAFEQCDASQKVYLGDIDMALSLLDKGIKQFYYRTPQSCVASIGYDPDTKTWWGWSHRAIAKYQVGQSVRHDLIGYETATKYFHYDHTITSIEPITLHTEADCRKMAEFFAEEVS